MPRTTSAAQAPTPVAGQDIPAQKTGAAAASGTAQCPQCATLRVPGKRFCRSCRFDFAAQPEGEAAAVVAAPEEAVTTVPEVAAVPLAETASVAETPRASVEAPATTSRANSVARPEDQTVQTSAPGFTETSTSVHTSNAKGGLPMGADHRTAGGTAAAPASTSGRGGGGNKAWIIGGAALVVIGLAVGAGLLLRSQHGPAATEDAAASVRAPASALPAAATASEQVAAAPAPASAGTSPDAESKAAAAPAQTVAASETSATPAAPTAVAQQSQEASSSEAPAIPQARALSAATAITGGPQVMTSPEDIKLRDCAGATCATLLSIPKGTRLTIDPATIKVVTDRSGAQRPWAKISYEGIYCPAGTTCRHMVRSQMAMDGWLDVKSLVPVAP